MHGGRSCLNDRERTNPIWQLWHDGPATLAVVKGVGNLEKIAHHLLAKLSTNRLGMKLYSVVREGPVPDAHEDL